MDEFQEADILWPDTEDDELLAPFAPMDTEEELYAGSVSSVAPVVRRRFQGFVFLSLSAGASLDADDDDEEWQEADVLWPDTPADEPRGSGSYMRPFPGSSACSGRASRRRVKPAAAGGRDRWTTGPPASSPIDIPEDNVARRRLFRTAMNRRR